jgi:aconitate hydratase
VEILGVNELVRKFAPGKQLKVRSTSGAKTTEFNTLVRIDTPQEAQYYANGGILPFVLRQLIASKPSPVHA